MYDHRFLITFSDQQVYRVVFSLTNTAGKTVILRTKLPSYESVELKSGQTFNLNTTVPDKHVVFITVYDAVTNERTKINGKSTYLIFPKLHIVPVRPTGKFSLRRESV